MEQKKVLKLALIIGAIFIFVFCVTSLAWQNSEKMEEQIVNKTVNNTVSETEEVKAPEPETKAVATASNATRSNATHKVKEKKAPGWETTENGYAYRDVLGNLLESAWIASDGKTFYVDENGIRATNGFYEIGNSRYFFDDLGNPVTGRFYINETEYFADETGRLYSDEWVTDEDDWYYVSEDGTILKNDLTPDHYYMDEEGHILQTPDVEEESSLSFHYTVNGRNRNLILKINAATIIWDYFKEDGWTDVAIAGVLGNWQQECGLNPDVYEKGGTGYGLGQWSHGRRTAFEEWAKSEGLNKANIYTQLKYLLIEPYESNYIKQYKVTEFESPAAAAKAWMYNWERPKLSTSHLDDVRIPYANAYYAHFVHGVDFLVASEPDIDEYAENQKSEIEKRISFDSDETEEDDQKIFDPWEGPVEEEVEEIEETEEDEDWEEETESEPSYLTEPGYGPAYGPASVPDENVETSEAAAESIAESQVPVPEGSLVVRRALNFNAAETEADEQFE